MSDPAPAPSRTWLLHLALPIAFVAIGVAVATHDHARLDRRPIPSTYNSGPFGPRGFYVALEEMGVPVQRIHEPFTELPRGGPFLMVVTAPTGEPITIDEVEALMEWLSAGNSALILADGERHGGEPDRLDDAAGESEPADRRLLERLEIDLLVPMGMPVDPALLDPLPTVPAVTPGPHTFGCPSLYVGGAGGALHRQPLHLPLYADRGVQHATILPLPGGKVFFFSSLAPIANRSLSLAHNFEALLNIVQGVPGLRGVLFDEFHHGHGTRHTWGKLTTHPAFRWTLAQAALVLVLFLLGAGHRFGPLRPPPTQARRSTMEFVDSMSGLYRRAGPSGEIVRALLRGIRYDLWCRWGLPVHHREDAVAERVAAATGRAPDEVRRVLTDAAALATHPRVDPHALVRVARRLHDLFERKDS